MLRLGESYSVQQLIPHRGPMCLLDSVVDYGEDWLRARVGIRAGGVFAGPAGVPGWVGVEYMAQAAGAFAGIEQVQRGETPTIGLLIGARYYRCMLDTFPLGTELDVTARLAMRDDDDFAAYECVIALASREIASCTLKAYRPRDIREWLPERKT
jgi:predicted hotdog family 3-hydroxylacyl-ACP dehydratase